KCPSSSLPMSVSTAATFRNGIEYLCERYLRDAPISPSGPPYWLMINFAIAGFGFLILTGYCSFFSYVHMLILHFPRPRCFYPGPTFLRFRILRCQRTELILIHFNRFEIPLQCITVKGQCRPVGRMGIQKKSRIIQGKAVHLYLSHRFLSRHR